MIKILKKELLIYTALLILMIILIHPDLLTHPSMRLELMQEKGNYIHPFLYTIIIYIVLSVFRIAFVLIMKLFGKKDK